MYDISLFLSLSLMCCKYSYICIPRLQIRNLEVWSAKTCLGALTKAISKIGGGGAPPQNCERALIR